MSIHVVVFESEPYLARMISCRLMRADFEVHTVHDVESACELIHRLQPQLLVTDIQPPALELARRVRSAPDTADLPILALTSVGDDPAKLEALQDEWRFFAMLPKPFSPRRLVRLAMEATHAEALLTPAG